MTEGLLRQRRNLMIVSLIIVLLSFGGVEIQEVGALGTKLAFGNKSALYIGLWIIFIYFLFRYYQYFLEEDDRGIAEAFWAKVNALLFNILRKAAAAQHSLQLNQLAGEFRFSELKTKSQFICTGTVVTSRNEYGDQTSSEYKINIFKYSPAFVLAAVHVAVNRSVLTDYLLPFLVAIAALIAGFSGSWEGSLCKVVGWHTFQRLCS